MIIIFCSFSKWNKILYFIISTLLIFEDLNKENDFKKNIRINDLIIYFYIFINLLAFFIGIGDASNSIGETFLGARSPFIYYSPNTASQQFLIFSLYFNFKMFVENNRSQKYKYFIFIIFLFILSLYTGGRSGIIVSTLSLLSTSIIYFFPNFKYIFITQKKLKNKIFMLVTLFLSSVFFLLFPLIKFSQEERKLKNKFRIMV